MGNEPRQSSTNRCMPRISIAIPTVGRIAYVQEALDSALKQSYAHVEVIVSDNASSDGTAEYLSSRADPRLRVFHHPVRMSMVANWNFCLSKCTGDYLILLSDDDRLDECICDAFCRAIALLSEEDRIAVGILYGPSMVIDGSGVITEKALDHPADYGEGGTEFLRWFFRGRRAVTLCSTLFHAEALRSVGGFPESVGFAADSAARGLLAIRCRVYFVRDAIAYYRIHEGNESTRSYSLLSRTDSVIRMVTMIARDSVDGTLYTLGLRYARRWYINEVVRAYKGRQGILREVVTQYLQRFSIHDLLLRDIYYFVWRHVTGWTVLGPLKSVWHWMWERGWIP